MNNILTATLTMLLASLQLPLYSSLPAGDSLAPRYDTQFSRPLAETARQVERQFHVRLKFDGIDTAGLRLPYADFRLRPYSLDETLTNICAAYDWKWYPNPIAAERPYKSVRIKPYDYPRRRADEGRQMLEYLSSLYGDRAQWERRREALRRDVRRRLGIDAFLDSCIQQPRVLLSKRRRHDGYTMQNICIPLMDGLHLFGTIYAPTVRRKDGHALIICPDGHWQPGRYRAAEQLRLASLARMGAVCADFDLYGWGESAREVGRHDVPRAHVYQAACSLKLLDWLLSHYEGIDPRRVGVCGGSGGGTHTVLLALLDDRIQASAPVVHVASHFDGGCPCESGMPVQLAAGGTCEAELCALIAPRPLLLVSDGGDWTATTPTLELPFIRRIYGFYGASAQVRNVHLPDERHDFEASKRHAVYDFFAEVFALDRRRADESKVTIEPSEQMKSLYK